MGFFSPASLFKILKGELCGERIAEFPTFWACAEHPNCRKTSRIAVNCSRIATRIAGRMTDIPTFWACTEQPNCRKHVSELPGASCELPPELPGAEWQSSLAWGMHRTAEGPHDFGWHQQGSPASLLLAGPCFCTLFVDFWMVPTFRPALPISGRV